MNIKSKRKISKLADYKSKTITSSFIDKEQHFDIFTKIAFVYKHAVASIKIGKGGADAAGMGVATLYRHFSTKTAIAASSAIVMWSRLMETYEELVATEAYASLDGAGRLETLLSTYCDQCVYQPGFAAFLDELDRLMLAGDVTREAIDSYTQQLGGAYHHFEEAYRLGLADGSIARETDFPLFYRSVAHALLCVASKLSRGEVLPTDDFSHARDELTCITDMAIRSLRIQG